MKTWGKVLLGIAGAIVLFVAAIFYFTSGVSRVGDDFFLAVGSGDMDRAHAVLSADFRAGTSDARLAAYLAANGMDKVTATSWSSRSVGSGRGSLAGSVTTEGGENVPVEIDLVEEEGQWKIFAIRTTHAKAGVSNTARGLPDERQQVMLVIESMEAFVDAVAAQDMTGFHDHISRVMAGQLDVAELDASFKSFFPFGSDLQVIKKLTPAFDGPAILSDESLMEIKGSYPISPDPLQFKLKYVYEGTGWKLLGITVNV